MNNGGFSFPECVTTEAIRSGASDARRSPPGPAATGRPAAGVTYTTTIAFDLKDASPGTLELWCWLFTHDRLTGLRLNGKRVAVPKLPDNNSTGTLFELGMPEGFVRGANRLEINVDDRSPTASAKRGPPRFFLALGGYWLGAEPEKERGSALPSPASTAAAGSGKLPARVPSRAAGQ